MAELIDNCHWIIENFTQAEDVFLLEKAVKNNGHKLTLIGPKNGFEYKHIQLKNECVIFYGSIQMSKLIYNYLNPMGCFPILWETNDSFNCTNYWPRFQNFLFNDRYEVLTVKTLKETKWEIYHKYGKEALIFIRPDTGVKLFSGRLLDLQDFDSFFEDAIHCNATDSDIVCVSTPKNIIGEWRYIVTNEKNIIAKSCYKYQGLFTQVPSAPSKADEFVMKILDVGYYPSTMFTIDICQDSDGNFWLLEFNSFNNSGLYSCDKNNIVKEASRLAIKEYNSYDINIK